MARIGKYEAAKKYQKAKVMVSAGMSIKDASKKVGIDVGTFYRRRLKENLRSPKINIHEKPAFNMIHSGQKPLPKKTPQNSQVIEVMEAVTEMLKKLNNVD